MLLLRKRLLGVLGFVRLIELLVIKGLSEAAFVVYVVD